MSTAGPGEYSVSTCDMFSQSGPSYPEAFPLLFSFSAEWYAHCLSAEIRTPGQVLNDESRATVCVGGWSRRQTYNVDKANQTEGSGTLVESDPI